MKRSSVSNVGVSPNRNAPDFSTSYHSQTNTKMQQVEKEPYPQNDWVIFHFKVEVKG